MIFTADQKGRQRVIIVAELLLSKLLAIQQQPSPPILIGCCPEK
jgi:hypothetical protein